MVGSKTQLILAAIPVLAFLWLLGYILSLQDKLKEKTKEADETWHTLYNVRQELDRERAGQKSTTSPFCNLVVDGRDPLWVRALQISDEIEGFEEGQMLDTPQWHRYCGTIGEQMIAHPGLEERVRLVRRTAFRVHGATLRNVWCKPDEADKKFEELFGSKVRPPTAAITIPAP